MYSIDDQGWLWPAEHCHSPNCSDRPEGVEVDLLVIHNISLPAGEFGGGNVQRLFCNTLDCASHPGFSDLDGLCVSSHLFIDRRGGVTQFVSFDKRAWHAGLSQFEGRDNCNDFSVGIELEGSDNIPYTQQQYEQLLLVTKTLQCYYPGISASRITGHSDIAPGRKTDPGPAFDWAYYKNALT
ncbi:negative regulator of beta-lactamase expression [Spongiibacter sp. IMCC21906]|uniref:1,6-anhydro-N-acetylmuramyl-L-alanine amidase AmpD n=1 Tax=Spongiibacter sp. IMCC21906 TaxID=1620392 RepID=UPI00062E0954|nr:1,6-anhydro-N-acetylmuramyl-L-alanine amidase AmpD [Spongiibacter sp. IMCC21906]AKH68915.1 negative regulator of beta-lactamase expression [Spongiibacter sp. IMCC21906]